MKLRLTDSSIRKITQEVAAAGSRQDVSDTGCVGLQLRVAPRSQVWVLLCRDSTGRTRRFPLGAYPVLGVGAAREAAKKLHHKVRYEGADPLADRRKAKAQARDARDGIGTLEALLDTYARVRGARLKTWAEGRRRIESVFAPHLQSPLAKMKKVELQLAADDWGSKTSASAAVRYLRPLLKWAAKRELCDAGLTLIEEPQPPRERERVVSHQELAALLPALTPGRPHADVLRFILLTLARLNEVCEARWRDIDWNTKIWTVPNPKNTRPDKPRPPHLVPLSCQALALLRSRLPADPDPNGFVFPGRTGTRLGQWDRETKAISLASGTSGWHRHDLRRTGATMLGEMGVPPHIIDCALDHTVIHSALHGRYSKARYRPQVAAALQQLADALDNIESGGGEVVPLIAAAQ
jgi:integrase